MDVQNVLARNVFVHKSPVVVLCWRRWECSTSGGCMAPVVAVELSVVSLE
jgi:hypothetical protein